MYIYWTDIANNKFPFPIQDVLTEEKKEQIREKLNSTYGEGQMKSFVVTPYVVMAEDWHLMGTL